jgi:LacI family transcriptional regulator
MSSLRRLAKQLNLSVTTVSRALDGYDDVAPRTRERVQALATELNYSPNAAARSLRRNKAEAVACTLPQGTSHVGLASLVNMMIAAEPTFAAAGLDLLILPTSEARDELQVLRRLIDGRRADAFVLLRTFRDDPRVAYLLEKNIPFVTHGRTQSTVKHASIDGNGAQGFGDATRELIRLGHRRIAHLAAPQEFMFAFDRHRGWQSAMTEAGLAVSMLEQTALPNEIGGRDGALALLARKPRPTALLCATDAMAMGAMRAVQELGLAPGRDVAIIGHDDLPSAQFTSPPLSTMRIDAADVGSQLAGLLLRRMKGEPIESLQIVLPVSLVLRGTHGPPPD